MAELHTLMTGIALGESPRWHDGRLWFADWGAHQLIAVAVDGRSEVMLRVPSLPFSIDWQPDGRLLVVSGTHHQLLRQTLDGSLEVLAELGPLSEKPWNEMVVDGRGNVYLNNIGFDFPAGEVTTGIIAVVTPDGAARQVADSVAFPNGMAVTPDNGTLIVAESYAGRLTAFNIDSDGGLSHRRIWADLGDAAPDGICLDADGAVWYADVPHQRCVRVAEGGTVLSSVDLDRGAFACMLGGPDGRTLFTVAAEWPAAMQPGGPRTGQLIGTNAPAAGTGWPRTAGT